jgi:hypothetical protein
VAFWVVLEEAFQLAYPAVDRGWRQAQLVVAVGTYGSKLVTYVEVLFRRVSLKSRQRLRFLRAAYGGPSSTVVCGTFLPRHL